MQVVKCQMQMQIWVILNRLFLNFVNFYVLNLEFCTFWICKSFVIHINRLLYYFKWTRVSYQFMQWYWLYWIVVIMICCWRYILNLKLKEKSGKRENKNNFRINFIDESILVFDYCLDTCTGTFVETSLDEQSDSYMNNCTE